MSDAQDNLEDRLFQIETELQKTKYQRRLVKFELSQTEEGTQERLTLLKRLDKITDTLYELESWKNEVTEEIIQQSCPNSCNGFLNNYTIN